MQTMVTKFRLSRPTADTLAQITHTYRC